MILKNKSLWLAVLAGGAVLLPSLWFSWGTDQAVHCYTAWAWLVTGKLPYIGGWHHNFPGIDIIYLAAFKLFGSSMLGVRIMDYLFQILNLMLIYFLAYTVSRDSKSFSGFLAAVLYAVYYLGRFYYSSAQKDTMAFTFLLLALSLFLVWGRPGKKLGCIPVGLMIGLAFLMKPTFGLCGPVFSLLYLRREAKAGESLPKIVAEQAALALSAFLPFLVMVGLYWSRGQTGMLWENLWTYNLEMYIGTAAGSSLLNWKAWDFLVFSMIQSGQVIWLGFILFLFFHPRRWSEGQDQSFEAWLGAWGLLAACFVSIFIQGKDFPYHQIPFLGLACIFGGVGLGALVGIFKEKMGSPESSLGAYALAALVLLVHVGAMPAEVIQFSLKRTFRSLEAAYLSMDQSGNDYMAAKYIRERTDGEDLVMCWAAESPNVNFLAGRLAPSRFVTHMSAALAIRNTESPHPLRLEWQKEFFKDLEKSRPVYFVIQEEASFSERLGGASPFGLIPGLRGFIQRNYRLETNMGYLEIYRLKE